MNGDARAERATRRLRCDAFQAALHCTTQEWLQLELVLEQWRAGALPLEDAQGVVSALRARHSGPAGGGCH